MAVVKGVNIPDNKRIEIALTSIYGIGRTSAKKLVSKGKRCAHLYFGDRLQGNIKTTLVNGKIVYDKNKFYKNINMDSFVSPLLGNKICLVILGLEVPLKNKLCSFSILPINCLLAAGKDPYLVS